jgi:hypothetical protein
MKASILAVVVLLSLSSARGAEPPSAQPLLERLRLAVPPGWAFVGTFPGGSPAEGLRSPLVEINFIQPRATYVVMRSGEIRVRTTYQGNCVTPAYAFICIEPTNGQRS